MVIGAACSATATSRCWWTTATLRANRVPRPAYLGTLVDYVHLNPVRAGIIRASRGQSVADYPWSSVALGYAQPPSRRTEWLEVAEGLALYGWKDNASVQRAKFA